MKINNQFIKNTKIIATSGPTFETYEHMIEMIKRGVNVVRLNMSHGSFDEHQKRIENARKASKDLDVPVSIMLDTKGPEIRIHKFAENKAKIELNQKLTIHTHEEILGNEKEFSVTYYDLNKIVNKGDLILCDDGKLSLLVEKVDSKTGLIEVLAQNKHTLSNNKAVNVPGIKLTLPFVSEYDLKAIEWGLSQDIDFIAASFVSSAEDVLEIKEILKRHNKEHVQVISKIESVQSIQNINEIVTASDGIMLARGDLGVEIPYEKIPFFEKLIINKVRATGKSMIIATQMLDSMQQNPRPTRAEVTDVYYAALSGTDSTMLSGESASGLFPYQTVETMAKIDREAEMNFEYQSAYEQAYTYVNSKNAETSYEVAKLALNESISFVFALSSKGRLVKALSSFRLKANIIALVEDERLLTYFGTWYGVYTQKVNSIDEILNDENLFKKIANEIGIKDQKVILSNKKEFKVIKV